MIPGGSFSNGLCFQIIFPLLVTMIEANEGIRLLSNIWFYYLPKEKKRKKNLTIERKDFDISKFLPNADNLEPLNKLLPPDQSTHHGLSTTDQPIIDQFHRPPVNKKCEHSYSVQCIHVDCFANV